MVSETQTEAHVYFEQRGHRTYEQVATGCGLEFVPSLEPSMLGRDGRFLLHLAPGGKSHCVALSVSTRGEARLRDGVREWNLTTCEIMDLIDKAVDRKYMVFFSVQFSRGRNSQAVCAHERGNFAALLDMQAGANSAKPQVYDGDDSHDFAWDAADDAGQRVDEDDKDDTVISESDEEAATAVADELLEKLKVEVSRFMDTEEVVRPDADGLRACPFCPFRAWPNRKGMTAVRHHVKTYHTAPRQYMASGTKQMKIVLSLFDRDQCHGVLAREYLRASTEILRRTVHPGLSRKINCIDKNIRLVLTECGPEYWHVESVRCSFVRRVRNLYYTKGMAQLVYEEMLNNSAKAPLVN